MASHFTVPVPTQATPQEASATEKERPAIPPERRQGLRRVIWAEQDGRSQVSSRFCWSKLSTWTWLRPCSSGATCWFCHSLAPLGASWVLSHGPAVQACNGPLWQAGSWGGWTHFGLIQQGFSNEFQTQIFPASYLLLQICHLRFHARLLEASGWPLGGNKRLDWKVLCLIHRESSNQKPPSIWCSDAEMSYKCHHRVAPMPTHYTPLCFQKGSISEPNRDAGGQVAPTLQCSPL